LRFHELQSTPLEIAAVTDHALAGVLQVSAPPAAMPAGHSTWERVWAHEAAPRGPNRSLQMRWSPDWSGYSR
jgi:hypothetical protein